MSVVDKEKEIDELKADIHDIKNNMKLSEELKLQYIALNKELIIILEKKIEKLSPQGKSCSCLLFLFWFPSVSYHSNYD